MIAGNVPIYLKLAFKMMHPFRKRRFRKLLFNSASAVTASTDTFCDRNLAKRVLFLAIYHSITYGGIRRESPPARALKWRTPDCEVKSYMSFRLGPSMTLNGEISLILHYFTEFGCLRAHCVRVVDKPITMDNLRLLCLVVHICRGTAHRPRYKYSITASRNSVADL